MAVIYFQPMSFPTSRTEAIQITRLIGALGQRTDVFVVLSALAVEPDRLRGRVLEQYGVTWGPRVRVLVVPRSWFSTIWFPLGLLRVLARVPADAPFYTRSFNFARKLVRFRWLHRRRVFLESHKKAGYLREDPVPGSPYAQIRSRIEGENQPHPVIRRLYRDLDGVFFLHRHSSDIVTRCQPGVSAVPLWYGTVLQPLENDHPRSGYVYCGSIARSKLFELLLEALDLVHGEVRVTVYGTEPERVEELARCWKQRPAWDRVEFLPARPHEELQGELRRFRFGVALLEGLKVVDYLENGLVPIVPDLPSYREVLDDRTAMFFQPDDAASLAAALQGADQRGYDPTPAAELVASHRVETRAARVLSLLDSR